MAIVPFKVIQGYRFWYQLRLICDCLLAKILTYILCHKVLVKNCLSLTHAFGVNHLGSFNICFANVISK